MKPQTLFSSIVCGACTFFVLAPNMWLHAQTPPPGISPLPPPPSPSLSTPSAAQPQKKGLSLQIASGNLESAVTQLLQAVKAAQLPEINVIYGVGAADVGVPELSIRNVSAADGLRLIATSAGCETQPILSAQDANTIIGYKVEQRPPITKIEPALPGVPANAMSYEVATIPGPYGLAAGTANNGSPFKRGSQGVGGNPKNVGQSASVGMPGAPKTLKAPDGSRGAVNVMGDGRIVAMGWNSQNPAVRIYPLGTITTTVKFPDVEATLHDVLKAEGAIADSTKLALHEKTNVLVVTGPPQAQELVSQYIEALQKNQLAADNAAGSRNDLTRETTELRIELQAQEREKARLNEQLAKTEAELRALTHEMDRLRAAKAP